MKRALLIWSALVAASLSLGMLLGVVLATPASASTYGHQGDDDAYALIREMRDDGYTGSVDYAQHLAVDICVNRAEGKSQDYLIHYSEQTSTMELSIATVYGAEWHFCPAYFAPPWAG